ncbi:MAG: c-type cytochrome [Acidobacteriota bacterium]|nr:c-type cytochrome [Acidobacteriota bacterium]MDH3523340.1 c-type cytochrome [Acidobacteriota bacterium]
MRGLSVVLAVVVAALSAVALHTQELDVEREAVKWEQVAHSDGEALYAELCAVCHGVDAKGHGPAAPALAVPVPDLTRLALGYDGVFPFAEVEKSITHEKSIVAHGTLDMPVWGKVLRDVRPDYKPARREAFVNWRIYNLTSYLESLQAGPPAR